MFGTSPVVFLLGAVAVMWWAFVAAGGYIARQKGRSKTEGQAFGLFLGPLGLLIVALLPEVRKGD